MANPYESPQVMECRGPCGDSGCPHKPKQSKDEKWWHTAILMLIGGAILCLIVYLMILHSEAEAYEKWGPAASFGKPTGVNSGK